MSLQAVGCEIMQIFLSAENGHEVTKMYLKIAW